MLIFLVPKLRTFHSIEIISSMFSENNCEHHETNVYAYTTKQLPTYNIYSQLSYMT